ncbi:MAG: glycosyltransferase family 4 protein [Lachnospiraceae bacterium]|nr:glycosyltransferase family 4 protein [Lachnospiraceae bacterium]
MKKAHREKGKRKSEIRAKELPSLAEKRGAAIKVLLLSDRFVPASLALSQAFYLLCLEMNYQVKRFMNLEYVKYLDSTEDVLFQEQELDDYSPDLAIFLNVSLRIPHFLTKLKKMGCKCCYLLHEPYAGFKEMKKEKEFLARSLMRTALDCFICKKSDMVLLPSEKAYENYERYSVKCNQNSMIFPLIFPGGCEKDENEKAERKYFSYIGSFSSVHHAKGYLSFMRYAFEHKWNIFFQIFTRSNIEDYLKEDYLKEMIRTRQLVVQQGRPMTTEEINQAYQQSVCVWNLYQKSTQSGVLGNAFMLGTPVIASYTGVFREYVVNHYNGVLIEDIDNMDEIYKAYQAIAENVEMMAEHALETYFKKYHYSSQRDTMLSLNQRLFSK